MCDQCLFLITKADDDDFLDSLDLTNAERMMLEKLYKEGEDAIAELLQLQGAELDAAIQELSDDLLTDPDELLKVILRVQSSELFQDKFKEAMKKAFLPLFELAGKSEAVAVNDEAKWNTANKAAAKFTKQLEKLVPDMNETSRTHLLNAFSAAIEGGKAPAERAILVKEVSRQAASGEVGPFSMTRALRISRTMTTAAANGGKLEGWRQSGVVKKKRWRSANNKRTRADHRVANGQTMPIDKPFRVGREDLMFPGDPNGSTRQIINCRCTMQSVIVEDVFEVRHPGHSETYRQKLTGTHERIKEDTGYHALEHALNRLHGHINNGRIKSVDDVIDAIQNGKTYLEANGTVVKFLNGVSVHFAADNGEIKNFVPTKRPKAEWKELIEDDE